MSDSADKELKIRITTEAQLAGAEKAKEAISEVTKTTQVSTKETKEATKADIENEQAGKKLGKTKSDLKQIIQNLGREFPLLNAFGRAALNPLVAGFVLLANVVSEARKAIEELGNRSTPEFSNLQRAIDAQKTAIDEAQRSVLAYERAIARIASATDTVSQASSAYVKHLEAAKNAQQTIDEAAQKRDNSSIEAAEKAKLITHEQAIIYKFRLDEAYAQRRLKLEQELTTKLIAEKYREVESLKLQNNELDAKIKAATADVKTKGGAVAFGKEAIARDQESKQQTEEKIKALEEESASLNDQTKGFFNLSATGPQVVLRARKRQADEELLAQTRIKQQLEQRLKQEREAQFNREAAAEAANEEVGSLRDQRRGNTTRLNELGRTLPADVSQMRTGQGVAASVANAASVSRAIEANAGLVEMASKRLDDASSTLVGKLYSAADAAVRNLRNLEEQNRHK